MLNGFYPTQAGVDRDVIWASRETHQGPDVRWVARATIAMIPFVWHYEYTQDVDFLCDKAYPLMKELAVFWEDYQHHAPAESRGIPAAVSGVVSG